MCESQFKRELTISSDIALVTIVNYIIYKAEKFYNYIYFYIKTFLSFLIFRLNINSSKFREVF